jgi:antitoxin HicB
MQGAKAELYEAFRASHMRREEFARRVGMPTTAVDGLFDLGRRTRLEQIETAFAALGKRLAVEVQEAA